MRPTTILTCIAGVLMGLGGIALGVYAFVNRSPGKLWFFWIAPLLIIGFAGLFIHLTIQYWLRVGRLEVRGKPRQ